MLLATSSSDRLLSYPGENDMEVKLEKIEFTATQSDFPLSTSRNIKRIVTGIFTLGISEGLRKSAGYLSTHCGCLVPSQRQEDFNFFEQTYPDYKNFCTHITIHQQEGAKIEGMIISPYAKKIGKPIDSFGTFIIWLNGLGESYESKLNSAVEYARQAAASILLFNYRGSDSDDIPSSGNCFVADTLAMVEFLTTHQVPLEKITIHGYSMGGNIGALAASKKHIKHINDRSGDVFSKVAKSYTSKMLKKPIGKKAACITGSAVGSVLKAIDFDLDVRQTLENHTIPKLMVIHHGKDIVVDKERSVNHYADKKELNYESLEMKNNDFEDIREFIAITQKNEKHLLSLPFATYALYSAAGYTPDQYATMVQKELPKVIRILEKKFDCDTPSEAAETENQEKNKLAIKIQSLKEMILDIAMLNLNPSGHHSNLLKYSSIRPVFEFIEGSSPSFKQPLLETPSFKQPLLESPSDIVSSSPLG